MSEEISNMSDAEFNELEIHRINAIRGNLSGIECKLCNNKGYIAYEDNGAVKTKDCSCIRKRAVLRRMERSGLKDMVSRYKFDTFLTDEEWQFQAKEVAMNYCDNPHGWVLVSGNPGTGKTHICTAICGQLLKQDKAVLYFMWREDGQRLKAMANTSEYADEIRPYKMAEVLYIDDMFKGKISEADVNLAFDLINSRYNNKELITIISSELTQEKLMDVDQAVGSRIWERKRIYMNFTDKPNRRLLP